MKLQIFILATLAAAVTATPINEHLRLGKKRQLLTQCGPQDVGKTCNPTGVS